jgi:hypothetical protein
MKIKNRRELVDELTGATRDTRAEENVVVRDFSVRLANRTTRRGFLASVSRVSLAALGGTFLTTILRQETALANHCLSGPPASCLCRDLPNPGANRCRSGDCAGGSWLTCTPTGPSASPCRDPEIPAIFYRRFRDCCSACNQGCSHPTCGGRVGDVCCQDEPSPAVYCNNCHGNCPSNQDTVHCVTTSCTNIQCA